MKGLSEQILQTGKPYLSPHCHKPSSDLALSEGWGKKTPQKTQCSGQGQQNNEPRTPLLPLHCGPATALLATKWPTFPPTVALQLSTLASLYITGICHGLLLQEGDYKSRSQNAKNNFILHTYWLTDNKITFWRWQVVIKHLHSSLKIHTELQQPVNNSKHLLSAFMFFNHHHYYYSWIGHLFSFFSSCNMGIIPCPLISPAV